MYECCPSVCVRVCVLVSACAYVRSYLHACARVCVCVRACICIHACIYLFEGVCKCILFIYVCVPLPLPLYLLSTPVPVLHAAPSEPNTPSMSPPRQTRSPATTTWEINKSDGRLSNPFPNPNPYRNPNPNPGGLVTTTARERKSQIDE